MFGSTALADKQKFPMNNCRSNSTYPTVVVVDETKIQLCVIGSWAHKVPMKIVFMLP